MKGLQSRLLDLLNAASGPELAVMLAIRLNAPIIDVYAALVLMESRRWVRVVVPRNKKPRWAIGPGFNVQPRPPRGNKPDKLAGLMAEVHAMRA